MRCRTGGDALRLPTGMQHGTVTVLSGEHKLEVRPSAGAPTWTAAAPAPSPSRDIDGDLARRDFTVNTIAWDPLAGVLRDPLGVDDLRRCRLRAMGDRSHPQTAAPAPSGPSPPRCGWPSISHPASDPRRWTLAKSPPSGCARSAIKLLVGARPRPRPAAAARTRLRADHPELLEWWTSRRTASTSGTWRHTLRAMDASRRIWSLLLWSAAARRGQAAACWGGCGVAPSTPGWGPAGGRHPQRLKLPGGEIGACDAAGGRAQLALPAGWFRNARAGGAHRPGKAAGALGVRRAD
jgi:hypothetical protein